MRYLIALCLFLSVLSGALFFMGGEAMAETEAEFIQRTWLKPHNSRMDGDMIVACTQWYAPEDLRKRFMAVYLAICACETSLADPRLGGRLVTQACNWGCVRSGSPNTPWGQLATGVITVAGKKWWVWPDPWTGSAALGRLLKSGPGNKPGYYLECIRNSDFAALTGMYYGRTVSGYANYHKRWTRFYDIFSKGLADVR